jgi:hypothetical protein
VENLKNHSVFKISARWLLVASILCIWFGNGVHIHSLMDHIFDHGDVHFILHAHNDLDNSSENDHHSSSPESQNHEVAKVDLNGVLSPIRLLVTQPDLLTNTVAVVSHEDLRISSGSVFELDLPPPDIGESRFSPTSFSLRAPPLA